VIVRRACSRGVDGNVYVHTEPIIMLKTGPGVGTYDLGCTLSAWLKGVDSYRLSKMRYGPWIGQYDLRCAYVKTDCVVVFAEFACLTISEGDRWSQIELASLLIHKWTNHNLMRGRI
jgi:hypothetical protein